MIFRKYSYKYTKMKHFKGKPNICSGPRLKLIKCWPEQSKICNKWRLCSRTGSHHSNYEDFSQYLSVCLSHF